MVMFLTIPKVSNKMAVKSSKKAEAGEMVQQEIPTQADPATHFDEKKATDEDVKAMKNFYKKAYTDDGRPL